MAPFNKPTFSSDVRESKDLDLQIRYRTLSIHLEADAVNKKKSTKFDPATSLREIDAHLISPADAFIRYSSHPTVGLEHAVVERKSKNGKNVISPPKTQYWKKGLNYVFGGFNFLMWIAFIVTILSYEPLGRPDPAIFNLGVAVLLMLVITVSATFYAVVDWNASRIMKSIKSLIAEDATVLRDGTQQTIPATDLVVGDLVILSMGNRIPADLRLVQASSDLKFDRSLLTGESDPISGSIDPTDLNALETHNLALTSTFVVQGSCTGLVFAIGDRTVMGRIVQMSGEQKFKLTTIQKEVWFFTKIISTVALSLFSLSILVWGTWLRTKHSNYETASEAIINSIGCLTAFVPQGLPVCVALSLTIIAKRMAARKVLVKNLATIETLGCMSVLCSDKTGTLTVGKMSVQDIAFLDKSLTTSDLEESQHALLPAIHPLHAVARLCNGAKFEGSFGQLTIKGDATDTAVLRFADALPENSVLLDTHKKLFEIPFNSKNKWMLSIVRENKDDEKEKETEKDTSSTWMLVKGAPDILFGYCSMVLKANGSIVPFDEAARSQMSNLQNEWSSRGQRVLALCRKPLDGVPLKYESKNTLEADVYEEIRDLTLIGLIGLNDPPRPDVRPTVEILRRAFVRVFMVTGDFKLTAISIAKQVGVITTAHIDTPADMRNSKDAHLWANAPPSSITPSDDTLRSIVVIGEEVLGFTSEDWDMLIGHYNEIVFARTTPEQKLIIVEEIKKRGDNTVAVTGDGVNDAPALKASDIGIAMGSGSDVAKEAAAMILLNNDFASIPIGVENGRLVFDNLKKVILYLMPAGTYTEFMAVLANVFFGMQLALSSYFQVCFSISNDVVMSISLMYEKPESDLMLRKPRNARRDRLADWRFFFQIYLFIGLMMWPCAMGMWFYYMQLQGIGFHDLIFAFGNWQAGYKGYTLDQLTTFVSTGQSIYYVTIVFMQYGGLLSTRNRRVSILTSNPLWGPRRNIAVPLGMIGTALIAVTNLYGPGLQRVFDTIPIPGRFWGLPFCFALVILTMDETRKAIVRSYPKSIIAKMAW